MSLELTLVGTTDTIRVNSSFKPRKTVWQVPCLLHKTVLTTGQLIPSGLEIYLPLGHKNVCACELEGCSQQSKNFREKEPDQNRVEVIPVHCKPSSSSSSALSKMVAYCAATMALAVTATAEPLDAYLRRVKADSSQITAIMRELDVERARARMPSVEYRPRVEAGWSVSVKQDSTLPVPKPDPRASWITSVEYVLFDYGARGNRVAAASHRLSAAEARLRKRVTDALIEPATLYVSAWKAKEAHSACRSGLAVMTAARERVAVRAKDKAATEADLHTIDSEIAGARLTCEQSRADQFDAEALLVRFGSKPVISKPWLPPLSVDPAEVAEASPEAIEAEEQMHAAIAEAEAARKKRFPTVRGFGNASHEVGKRDADFEVGAKVTFDLFDSTGSDVAVAQATAERHAARARYEAAVETVAARIVAARQGVTSGDQLVALAGKSLEAERTRLKDAEVRLATGKGSPIEIAQAARRVLTTHRQWVEAVAWTVGQQVKHAAAVGALGE